MDVADENNFFNDVFVFEETSGNVMGIDDNMYDDRITEEPIYGKIVTVALLANCNNGLLKLLIANLIDVLQFKFKGYQFHNYGDLYKLFSNEFIHLVALAFGQSGNPILAPIAINKYNIYTRFAQTEFSPFYFVRVFDQNVWYAVAGIIIAGFVIFALFNAFVNKFDFNFIEMIYFTLGMATVRESDRMNVTLRVACFILSLFLLMIMASFSTFLTLELAVETVKIPFRNLDEFRLQNNYGLCTLRNSYFQWLFGDLGYSQNMNGGNCRADDSYDILESICNYDKTAYITSTENVESILGFRYGGFPPCKIFRFLDELPSFYESMPITSNFKYKRQINLVITKHRTSGCLVRMGRFVNRFRGLPLYNRSHNNLTPIEFNHLLLIYGIFWLFMIIALVIFICEWLIFKLFKRNTISVYNQSNLI